MKKLLQTLTETFSPSGYEDAIRAIIRTEVKPYADEIKVDTLGSLIVRKGTLNKGGKRILKAETADVPALASANGAGIRRLLLILIDNALKHTPDGGTVTVSSAVRDGVYQRVLTHVRMDVQRHFAT